MELYFGTNIEFHKYNRQFQWVHANIHSRSLIRSIGLLDVERTYVEIKQVSCKLDH